MDPATALESRTQSVYRIPGGRAVCFGAHGPVVVPGALGDLVRSVAGPATEADLVRLLLAAEPEVRGLSLSEPERGQSRCRRAIALVYAWLRRQANASLVREALGGGLLAPSVASVGARSDGIRAVGGATPAERNAAILASAGHRITWLQDRRQGDASRESGGCLSSLAERYLGCRVGNLGLEALDLAVDSAWNEVDLWTRFRGDAWFAVVHLGHVAGAEGAGHCVSPTWRPPLVRPPSSLTSLDVALDNRTLLPPFSAGGGAVFGSVLGLMYPRAVCLELPFAADRTEPPPTADDRAPALLALLDGLALPAAVSDSAVRLALVGQFLVSSALMSTSALRDLVTCSMFCRVSAGRAVPGEVVGSSLESVRAEIAQYGALLLEWPSTWQAAAARRRQAS